MTSYEITIQALQIRSSNMGFGIYSEIIFYPSHHHFILKNNGIPCDSCVESHDIMDLVESPWNLNEQLNPMEIRANWVQKAPAPGHPSCFYPGGRL